MMITAAHRSWWGEL